jgi:hypothetical protein
VQSGRSRDGGGAERHSSSASNIERTRVGNSRRDRDGGFL